MFSIISLLITRQGFSVSNSPPFSTQRETINLLSNHYPERLGLAIILHPPFYFTVFFSVLMLPLNRLHLLVQAIRPFIPTATSQKIVFCKATDPKVFIARINLRATNFYSQKIMAELSAHISPENLETDYGVRISWG